jgi:hypothetical protein
MRAREARDGDFLSIGKTSSIADFAGSAVGQLIEAASGAQRGDPSFLVPGETLAQRSNLLHGGFQWMPAIGESEKLDARRTMTLAGFGYFQGVCQIGGDLLAAEKPFANESCSGEGAFAIGGIDFHDAQQGWPIHLVDPPELARGGVQKARQILGCENKSPFIKASSSGSAKHLQQLVGAEFALETGVSVAGRGDHDGTHRKIDPRREAGGGDDDMELPGFPEWFDPVRSGRIGEAAVMKGHAVLQESGQVAAEEALIFRSHAKRAVHRQDGRDLGGHFFRIAAPWGK